MIKIIHNNMIIDVNSQAKYIRYLPKGQKFIGCDKEIANAILGSDNNTVYHLAGTPYNFPNEIQTVIVKEISQEEYQSLTSQLMLQKSQYSEIKDEVTNLKKVLTKQNELIQKLLNKFS